MKTNLCGVCEGGEAAEGSSPWHGKQSVLMAAGGGTWDIWNSGQVVGRAQSSSRGRRLPLIPAPTHCGGTELVSPQLPGAGALQQKHILGGDWRPEVEP